MDLRAWGVGATTCTTGPDDRDDMDYHCLLRCALVGVAGVGYSEPKQGRVQTRDAEVCHPVLERRKQGGQRTKQVVFTPPNLELVL